MYEFREYLIAATWNNGLHPHLEFQRQLPWSQPGDIRAEDVVGVRRVRVKGHDPSRRRKRGPVDEEGGRGLPQHLSLNAVRTDSCGHEVT